MYQHPYFDLRLHTDEELLAIVGSRITERHTLHEWPLSCVQRLHLEDGRKAIYKTQSGPSLEPQFYQNALSPLLIPARTIYHEGHYSAMLFDFLHAPLLSGKACTAGQVLEAGQQLEAQINAITGDLPCYLDISSIEGWGALVNDTHRRLHTWVASGQFTLLSRSSLDSVQQWAFSDAVLQAVHDTAAYLHGDLTAENVFVMQPGEYRVIDWATPRRGPRGLDLASLLDSLGFDAALYVERPIVQLMDYLRLYWFVQCQARWICYVNYEQHIVPLIAKILA